LNNSGGSFGFSLSCNEGILFFTQAVMEVLCFHPPRLIFIDEGSLLGLWLFFTVLQRRRIYFKERKNFERKKKFQEESRRKKKRWEIKKRSSRRKFKEGRRTMKKGKKKKNYQECIVKHAKKWWRNVGRK
jgi:hypothetical protein